MTNHFVNHPPGLRESVPISDGLLHALHRAKRVYLLLWSRDGSPHALVITALDTADPGAWPSNYRAVPCTLIIPPSIALHPKEPSPS